MDRHMDICNSRVAFATEKQEVALWSQAQTESILTGSPAVWNFGIGRWYMRIQKIRYERPVRWG